MAKAVRNRKLTDGQEYIAWIEKNCRIPEGKFVGQPVKLRPWQKRIVREIYDTPTRRAIISFGRKNAKGLALDTPIPTPSGWTTMGALRVGDEVYAADGTPCRVIHATETHFDLRCWRVRFSDGSSLVADEEHQWLTRHRYRPWVKARKNGSGNGGRYVTGVVTTPQIAESVLVGRADGGRERNHKIDSAPALLSADVPLPIQPYVLGAWLGDGTSKCANITVGEFDRAAMAWQLQSELGYAVKQRVNESRATTLQMTGKKGAGGSLQSKLRALGVLGNKHIPKEYLDAGTAQRWALLQGLMDTDGTVTRHAGQTTPRCSFTSTNSNLATGCWRLARSLGLKATIRVGKAKLNGKEIGDVWAVSFPATNRTPVFRLTRKQTLLPDSLGKRSGTLTITGCDEVRSVPTRCIMVDAPDSLYLAGHGCIPTHNTTLAAFLLLLHLVGPAAKQNSQLNSAAQSVEQAGILFRLAAKIVRLSPELAPHVVIRDTVKQLACRELGTLYHALSAEVKTSFGLSPVFCVHDELGQVRGPRSDLYEALETAAGAHDNPLSIVISTQAPSDADLLSLLIDDARTGADPKTKLFLFTADPKLDPFKPATWKLANPAYGDFLNADEVRAQAEAAERMPSRESSFRNLILNQRVSQMTPFIPRAVWELGNAAPEAEVFAEGDIYVGLDLSARNDLTALVATARDGDGVWHVRAEFFAPEAGIADRAHRDRAPYDLWAEQGVLTTTPGASVDYAFVAARLCSWCDDGNVVAIAFDRWRIDVLKAEIARLGRELPLVEFGQGFRDMSPALDALESELLNGKIRHGSNPLLNWCASNAIAIKDPAMNRKLDKAKSTGRIDGLVALAMALGSAAKSGAPTEQSFWEVAAA